MNARLACFIAAGAMLACESPRVAADEPVSYVDVLVDGSPRHRYAHHGRWYIEAIKGREYAIQLRNPFGVRVAVALSVDGLNTIDARQTSAPDARKWVLEPYQTVTISGWQTSRTEARRFEFTTEERSYGQALGKTANFGIISAVFFKERVPEVKTLDESARSRAPQPSAAPAERQQDSFKRANEELAATGMGRRTDHVVTQVRLTLEDAPAHAVNIRYEFRPQLVRLGILPSAPVHDPLQRRERARGFEPGFAPVPASLR
jgi:hypothetical protein